MQGDWGHPPSASLDHYAALSLVVKGRVRFQVSGVKGIGSAAFASWLRRAKEGR